MLHLTSANCTHLPAEGYAGAVRGISRARARVREREGGGDLSCTGVVMGKFGAFEIRGWKENGAGVFVRLSDSGRIDRATCMCYIPPGSSVRT